MVEVDKTMFCAACNNNLCLNIFMQKCDKSMSGPMLWLSFQMHEIPKVNRCCKLFTDVFIEIFTFFGFEYCMINVISLWFKRQDTVCFSKTNNCEFKWNKIRSFFPCSMQKVQNIIICFDDLICVADFASECETLCLVWSMHYRCTPHDFCTKTYLILAIKKAAWCQS